MTIKLNREDWLKICRLNQEWYFRSTIEDVSDDWIKDHMPSDDVFDDGRLEFFAEKFNKEI